MSQLSVLLATEGTYPFAGGGVSTWCDILIRGLPEVDFTLYAVTGTPNVAYRYDLPANVRRVIHIPLWGTEGPAEYILADLPFAQIYRRKRATTEEVIAQRFIPLFRRFLEGIEVRETSVTDYGLVIHGLYRYFQEYDYNLTFKSQQTWEVFKEETLRPYRERPGAFRGDEVPNAFDLTTALRWLYNMLMPLNAPVPRTDIVHTTVAASCGLAGIIAKFEYGTPFIVTDHGVYARERYIAVSATDFTFFAKRFLINLALFFSRLNYAFADQVSPVANFNRRWEVPLGADPRRVVTIHNGVDPGRFRPAPKPAKHRDLPVAVAAARVTPIKDIKTMIRATALARREVPDLKVIVYGSLRADPLYVQECRDLVAELGLEEHFEFGGFHSEPHRIYTEGDISLLSSISEGFPYTVLESMACGVPVVATDVGGVREALEGVGIIVPPKDPEAFAAGMVRLLTDHNLRLTLGRRGRETVLARFRISATVEGYRTAYRQMANGRQQTTG